jgi:hypothetical protein
LRRWSFDKFGAIIKELEELKKKMEELSLQNPIKNKQELDRLRARMEELLYREEMMWLQRSRVAWLKEGDRNIKFFHKKAAGRARKNKIKHIRCGNGQFTKDKKKMSEMTKAFF